MFSERDPTILGTSYFFEKCSRPYGTILPLQFCVTEYNKKTREGILNYYMGVLTQQKKELSLNDRTDTCIMIDLLGLLFLIINQFDIPSVEESTVEEPPEETETYAEIRFFRKNLDASLDPIMLMLDAIQHQERIDITRSYPDFPYDDSISQTELWAISSYYEVFYDDEGKRIKEDYYSKKWNTQEFYLVKSTTFHYEPLQDSSTYYLQSIVITHFIDVLGYTLETKVINRYNPKHHLMTVVYEDADGVVYKITRNQYNEEGVLRYVGHFDGKGEREGVWQYYSEIGCLEKEAYYQDDQLLQYLIVEGLGFQYYTGDGTVITRNQYYNIE
jgi:hypothetical protein